MASFLQQSTKERSRALRDREDTGGCNRDKKRLSVFPYTRGTKKDTGRNYRQR